MSYALLKTVIILCPKGNFTYNKTVVQAVKTAYRRDKHQKQRDAVCQTEKYRDKAVIAKSGKASVLNGACRNNDE